MSSQVALHPMLNIAIKAARAAGAIINRASLDLERLTVSAKAPNDFVTEVDQAAEEAIIDVLLQAYPGHGILGEETGRTHGAPDSEYVWIIDPLDGTTNFIHGMPFYAVSIALAHRGQVQQAVVYDPSRNDLYYATKGRGAFLNDRRLRVSRRTRMAEALIGTGFPFRRGDNFQRYMRMFEEVMKACAGVRRPGAAALDLCFVAAGHYDGFFETGLSPWDIAAGSLIITEAGGLIGNFTGEADFLYQREVVAGSPKIYGQLVQMLKPYTRVIKAGDEADASLAAGGAEASGAFAAPDAAAPGAAAAAAAIWSGQAAEAAPRGAEARRTDDAAAAEGPEAGADTPAGATAQARGMLDASLPAVPRRIVRIKKTEAAPLPAAAPLRAAPAGKAGGGKPPRGPAGSKPPRRRRDDSPF